MGQWRHSRIDDGKIRRAWRMMRPMPTPRVLIFDVNETLLDIEALAPTFEDRKSVV